MSQPTLIIIGGANGSGKTTLAVELIAEENLIYLGADDIARELNPKHPEQAAIEAARVFSKRIDELIENGKSLIVESTLSGLSLRNKIEKAKTCGYAIEILFVYLDSPELCIKRVAVRVAKGGHNVPDADIKRRFWRSNANFWKVYKQLADNWFLFFNVGDSFEQISNGDAKGVTIIDEARYKQWLEMVK